MAMAPLSDGPRSLEGRSVCTCRHGRPSLFDIHGGTISKALGDEMKKSPFVMIKLFGKMISIRCVRRIAQLNSTHLPSNTSQAGRREGNTREHQQPAISIQRYQLDNAATLAHSCWSSSHLVRRQTTSGWHTSSLLAHCLQLNGNALFDLPLSLCFIPAL